MIEAALDAWGRLRIELDLLILGMDTVDKVLIGSAVVAFLGMVWMLWELAIWNTGSSSM